MNIDRAPALMDLLGAWLEEHSARWLQPPTAGTAEAIFHAIDIEEDLGKYAGAHRAAQAAFQETARRMRAAQLELSSRRTDDSWPPLMARTSEALRVLETLHRDVCDAIHPLHRASGQPDQPRFAAAVAHCIALHDALVVWHRRFADCCHAIVEEGRGAPASSAIVMEGGTQ